MSLRESLTGIVENTHMPVDFRQSAQRLLDIGFTASGLGSGEVLNIQCIPREEYIQRANAFRSNLNQTLMTFGTNHPHMPRQTATELRGLSQQLNGADDRSPGKVYDMSKALLNARATARTDVQTAACPSPSVTPLRIGEASQTR